jgi:regulator of replication initiation timing
LKNFIHTKGFLRNIIDKLEERIENLQKTIDNLENHNKNLADSNNALIAENFALSEKLKSTEIRLDTAFGEIDSVNQRSLSKTVEILDVPNNEAQDVIGFVTQYGCAIGCEITENDLNNCYSKTQQARNNSPKTKIILEFMSLKKRMKFYYASRDFRFGKNQQQSGGTGYRSVKVVDALTYTKKSIFLDIIEQRKQYKDIVKNVWINDGNIFIRRFGKTVAEPVKNQEFVELLFADSKRSNDDEN